MYKLFLSILVIYMTAILYACGNPQPDVEPKTSAVWQGPTDFSKLLPGDVVVKRGRGQLSAMIAKRLDEKIPLSHCGIVTMFNDSLYIIHSVSKELTGIDRTQKIDLKSFLNDCLPGSLYFSRIKDTSFLPSINNIAQIYLQRKVPFDYTLNLDSSKMNCSELLYHVLHKATGKELVTRVDVENKKALSFNSFLDTTNFSIVYHY